jgi:uncharacterized metal-binding protein YceD (DUF177 family)
MSQESPFTSPYDLGVVTDNGAELTLAPDAAAMAHIAAWLGIESVENLHATVQLTRSASGRYLYRGHFEADVVQASVVTLEPVPSHVAGDIERDYHLAMPAASSRRAAKKEPPPAVELSSADETTEFVESPVVDLAAPLLEELSLALDPYPRKGGEAFVLPDEGEHAAEENPFAVLKKLKQN